MLFKYALNAKTSELYVGTTPSVVLVGQIGMSLFSNSILNLIMSRPYLPLILSAVSLALNNPV
jgi:hypothetical protein